MVTLFYNVHAWCAYLNTVKWLNTSSLLHLYQVNCINIITASFISDATFLVDYTLKIKLSFFDMEKIYVINLAHLSVVDASIRFNVYWILNFL